MSRKKCAQNERDQKIGIRTYSPLLELKYYRKVHHTSICKSLKINGETGKRISV